MIYLDHNATTKLRPEALEAMLPFLKEEFANASSVHQAGQRARKAVEEAREELARFVGADDVSEIMFTSGGTEANNTAIRGSLWAFPGRGKRLVSTAIEHSSVRTPLRRLAEMGLADYVPVPVEPNGIVKAETVIDALTPDTVLAAIMAANNEVGTLQPMAEISKACREKRIPLFCDAVQLAGKEKIDVNALGCDLLSLSGHKFGAPKGVGILYIRRGTRLESLITGGRQEKNRRGGTENVAGIAAMGAAARAVTKSFDADTSRMRRLRDLFENEILRTVPATWVNGDRTRRVVNTANIAFECTDSNELLMAIDLKGVAASSGSACAAGSPEASHVLLAMGLPQEKAHASIRFSLCYTTTEDEIKSTVAIVGEAVDRLRQKHPLWKKMA